MRERARLETRSGWIEGRVEGPGAGEGGALRVFRGVPYARPPLGPRRWAPPAREASWSGVREALRSGPSAPQRPSVLMRMLGMDELEQDEDCLTLNVWTPAPLDARGRGADGGRRPVLVWLHGGAFTAGAGSLPVFSGARLAGRGDAVVVTVNYRLGALGWLALPERRADAEPAANFGLLDQIAALAWVREHAERLGGDPDNVTVFGESAGAMSIGALLGAPAARGLFRRAILQSGAAHNVTPWQDALRVTALLRDALGGADLAALCAAPVPALLDAQQRASDEAWRHVDGLAFQPVCEGPVPGAVLPRPPLTAVADGAAAAVSLLAGSNLDEWKLFALADSKLAGLDDEGLVRRVLRAPPRGVADPEAFARRALDVYRAARGGASGEARELWLALQADRVFRVPVLRLLERQLPHQPQCFAYLFAWPSPALDGRLGSCHGLEVPFVFGAVDDPRAGQLVGAGPAARRLSAQLMDAWLAFARDGDPGWPAYDETKRATMRFDRECVLESDPLGAERRLWEPLP